MSKEKIYIAGAFLIGIAYRLLMGLQGIDSTDMGFCMTFYQNVFTHPEAMPFYFNYYLTGLIGGLWHMLLGQFGLLGFRLLETLTLTAAIGLLYLAFRPRFTSAKTPAVAVLLSFLFPSIIVTFHYDTLSFLLIAASVYFLSRWHRGGYVVWLTLAGMMIGLSFFARIINGFLFLLILFPLFWGWQRSRRRAFDDIAYFGVGMLVGCAASIALMVLLGHLPYFGAALSEAFGSLYGHNNSSGVLIGSYLKSYVNIALQILAIAAMALYFGDGDHLAPKLKAIVRTVMIAALTVLIFTSQAYLSAVAVCTLMIVITRRPHPLTFYALACAYLFPLGSTVGIPSLFHWCGGLLIIPAASCYKRFTSQWQRTVICLVSLLIAANMVYKMGTHAYGEEEPRTKTLTRALPGTLNVMTTAERAENYRNVVARIQEYGKDNPWLLVANQASEFYYATGRLPFTGNTQMAAFMGEALTSRLDYHHRLYGRLPLIAFLQRSHDSDDMEEFREGLIPWMRQQGYRLVYHDNDVELYDLKEENNDTHNR